MIEGGSFQATRTTGTTSVCEIACSIGRTLFHSLVPCWRSMQSASKPPWRAITSAVKLLATESQPRVTHFLAAHSSLILFLRTVVSSRLVVQPFTAPAVRPDDMYLRKA